MIRFSRTLFAVAVIAATMVSGSLASPAGAAAEPGAEADFVARTNGARTSRGLAALTTDSELTAIARRWSQRMANDNRLSHNPNLANEVTQDWEKLAENVGVGPGVEEIHNAFMNSAPHRANILDGAVTHVGIGVVVDPSGQIWVTQVFMRLRGGGGSSPPPTAAPTTTTTRPPATTTTRPPAPPPAPAPAPSPTSPPTTRAPRATTTAPPATAPVATAPPAPAVEAEAAPPPTTAPSAPVTPTRRLVLVLDGLRALDRGR